MVELSRSYIRMQTLLSTDSKIKDKTFDMVDNGLCQSQMFYNWSMKIERKQTNDGRFVEYSYLVTYWRHMTYFLLYLVGTYKMVDFLFPHYAFVRTSWFRVTNLFSVLSVELEAVLFFGYPLAIYFTNSVSSWLVPPVSIFFCSRAYLSISI